MNGNSPRLRRVLSVRRLALLATAAAGLGAAALFFAPNMASNFASGSGTAAQAQNFTEKVQQLPQRPVGFADIVEKVKPAVISVRVKIDATSPTSGTAPTTICRSRPARRSTFLPALRHAQCPNAPSGHEVITGQGSGFFISRDGYAVTNNHVVEDADNVEVTTDDGKTYTAKVIGTDRAPISR